MSQAMEPEPRLALLAEVISTMPTAAFITDAGQATGLPRILGANESLLELTGYPFDEIEGRSPLMFARETIDEERRLEVLTAFMAGRSFKAGTVQKRPDGALYHVEWSMSPVHDDAGDAAYFLWLQGDVSRRVAAEQMRDTLFEALNLSDDSVIITGDDGIEFVNGGFSRLSGFEAEDVIGKDLSALDAVPLDWRTLEPFEATEPSARMLVRAKGRREAALYLDFATTAVVDATTGSRKLVHVGKDVTEDILRRSEDHAKAYRDQLTGLYNRRGGEAVLEAARGEAQASGGTFAVAMCDVDHFKSVNDRFGHAVGDLVLQALSGVLSSTVRAGDSAVRWGGEEFLLVLPGASTDLALPLAERVREAVAAEHVETAGAVTISVGVAEWFPDEGLASVVSRADRALYVSKTSGRNRTTSAERSH